MGMINDETGWHTSNFPITDPYDLRWNEWIAALLTFQYFTWVSFSVFSMTVASIFTTSGLKQRKDWAIDDVKGGVFGKPSAKRPPYWNRSALNGDPTAPTTHQGNPTRQLNRESLTRLMAFQTAWNSCSQRRVPKIKTQASTAGRSTRASVCYLFEFQPIANIITFVPFQNDNITVRDLDLFRIQLNNGE